MTTKRRERDFYPTPEWATMELLRRVPVRGQVFECCVGNAAIQAVIVSRFERVTDRLWNNDITQSIQNLDFQLDASDSANWESRWADRFDWIITNPPFSHAAQIVPLAYQHARVGIAMLLRLSFLEPVENRGAWLNQHPPTTLIVLPRISFTNDGRTDSVTAAWFVWDKTTTEQRIIIAPNPRFTCKVLPSPVKSSSNGEEEAMFTLR